MSNTPWPADASARRSIGELIPYARNSRLHSPAQVAKIAASMLEYGWTNAVLVDEHDNIIAGHGRIMAAELLVSKGHAQFSEAPVITAVGWSDAKKRAYVIADNKLALDASWDNEALALEIADLIAEDFDLSLTGFDDAEIEKLLPTEVNDLEADQNDFQPGDSGETSSGNARNALKFDGKSIPMSEDEVDRLNDAVERYIAEKGVSYGFVGTLLDAATAGNF